MVGTTSCCAIGCKRLSVFQLSLTAVADSKQPSYDWRHELHFESASRGTHCGLEARENGAQERKTECRLHRQLETVLLCHKQQSYGARYGDSLVPASAVTGVQLDTRSCTKDTGATEQDEDTSPLVNQMKDQRQKVDLQSTQRVGIEAEATVTYVWRKPIALGP